MIRRILQIFARCKHRQLAWPVNGTRRCLRCGADVPYNDLTLTTTDRQQASTVTSDHDTSGIKRLHRTTKVSEIRKHG